MTTTDQPPALRVPHPDGTVHWFGEAHNVRVVMLRHENPGQPEERWFVRPLHGDNFVGVELVDADGNIGVSQVQVLPGVSARQPAEEFAEEKAAAAAIITEVMVEPAEKATEIAAALVDAGWRPPEAEPYDYDPDYSDDGDTT